MFLGAQKTFVDGYFSKAKAKIFLKDYCQWPDLHFVLHKLVYSAVQCNTVLYGTEPVRSAGKIPSRLVSDCRPPPRRTSPLCPIVRDATRQLAVAGPAVVAVASTT